jgi:hypothetical protein
MKSLLESSWADLPPLPHLSEVITWARLLVTLPAAIDIVKTTKSYHILVIIADGQVDNVRDTSDAIVEASNYPLYVIPPLPELT